MGEFKGGRKSRIISRVEPSPGSTERKSLCPLSPIPSPPPPPSLVRWYLLACPSSHPSSCLHLPGSSWSPLLGPLPPLPSAPGVLTPPCHLSLSLPRDLLHFPFSPQTSFLCSSYVIHVTASASPCFSHHLPPRQTNSTSHPNFQFPVSHLIYLRQLFSPAVHCCR